ncbi:MAG: hypothetical protein Q8N94_08805, partial [Methanoregula sp.]|nr:hypothetical protein [Methanoregula sp.]
ATTATPAPTTAAVVVVTTTDVPVQTTTLASVVTTTAATITTIATTAAPTTDPILHRWIRQYTQNGNNYAYEFRFYPGGIVNYRTGPSTMVSSDIKLLTPPTLEASGTWSSLGNNKYLVQILPSGQSGAQLIREYTLVPAHEEKAYPGVVIKDHIESSYETEAINKGIQKQTDEMYYPERAKID